MNILINRATIEDAEDIRIAQKLAFEDCYNKYKFCPAYEATTEEVSKYISENLVYKIMLNERVIGSIFIVKLDNNQYELNTITIHPNYQNIGLGSLAIKHIENEYPNATSWYLETPEGEIRNRHLYEKFGYKIINKKYVNEYLTLIEYKK